MTNDTAIVDGFASVRRIIAQVFRKTPEFADKFVYRYLAYWSCESEEPFVWDGSKGDRSIWDSGTSTRKPSQHCSPPCRDPFSHRGREVDTMPNGLTRAPVP